MTFRHNDTLHLFFSCHGPAVHGHDSLQKVLPNVQANYDLLRAENAYSLFSAQMVTIYPINPSMEAIHLIRSGRENARTCNHAKLVCRLITFRETAIFQQIKLN